MIYFRRLPLLKKVLPDYKDDNHPAKKMAEELINNIERMKKVVDEDNVYYDVYSYDYN